MILALHTLYMVEPDLENFLPGDTVLADQEFDIAEDLAIRYRSITQT